MKRLGYREDHVNAVRAHRPDPAEAAHPGRVGGRRRDLVARGGAAPTVEAAAEAASVSRTTAYRYFPTQKALLVAAHPETTASSLVPDDAGDDPEARLVGAVDAFIRIVQDTEHQQRTMLRLSLDPDIANESLPLRQGRAIAWFTEALAPLRPRTHRHGDPPARALRAQRRRHRSARLAHRHRRTHPRGGRRADALVGPGPAARGGCRRRPGSHDRLTGANPGTGYDSIPLHYQRIAHRGACGKTPVVPQNRRPKAGNPRS